MTTQITALAAKLPYYQQLFTEQFQKNMALLETRINGLPEGVLDRIYDAINYITQWGQGVAAAFLKSLGGYLMSFSTFIVNFIVGIILAYFLSVEIMDWKRTAREKTPKTFKNAFIFLKENVFSGIVGYLKAQSKLISITFIVIFAALLALGVDNAFSIALLSAVFDVLPLLGVGTVFVPWIIYLFIVGNTTLAVWLTVLFAAVVLTRQFLEPKITGDTLGVSAFTMLAFMIVSLSLFGVAGVILSPILMILIKALYDQRYFHRWIHPPKGEFEPASEAAGADVQGTRQSQD
jgi:sporulation integral membrane protein YtvI